MQARQFRTKNIKVIDFGSQLKIINGQMQTLIYANTKCLL